MTRAYQPRAYTCPACPPGVTHLAKPRGRMPKHCPDHRAVHPSSRGKPAIPNGALVWEGPSRLNGEPIFVAVTGIKTGSSNPKIGRMAQVWILPATEEPKLAFKSGSEASVCGDCPHRWFTGGGCYVHWRWGPQQVYHTHKVFQSYGPLDVEWLRGRVIRFGAYGDPAAVPLEVWRPLLDVAKGWTGYTHQWRNLDSAEWGWLMASVDKPCEQLSAKRRGWRTFRIRQPGVPLMDREIICPAAEEGAGYRKVDCAKCRLCDGNGADGRRARLRDVAIVVHGQMAGRFR